MLTVYEDVHGRIAKIESLIEKQNKIGTSDQNSDSDNDQTGLEDDSGGNESNNKAPIETQGGSDSDGNKNGSPENGDVDQSKSEIVCRYYTAGKCQYGRVGSDCRYSHPKMCRKYIKYGYNNNGCTRGANCKFFHPKLCHNSVDFFKCDKVYCNFYDLVDSHRPNSGNSVKNNDQFMDSQQ